MYHPDRIADIVHFTIDPCYLTTHTLNLIIDPCYFVVNAMRECQELRCCHPNFILRQFIQSLESVFNIRLSQQLLQIFFWSKISKIDTVYCGKLTGSPLFYLLCGDSENIQNFHHYLHDDIGHRLVWSDLRIPLQTFEKVLDTFENVDQGLLRRVDILNRLTSFDVKLGLQRGVDGIQTWRRTPAPANITVAGEKTYVVAVKS